METWTWIVIGVIVLAVLLASVMFARRRRTSRLRSHFRDEYDDTLSTTGSRRDAERDLRRREADRQEIDLRPLSPAARERYRDRWLTVQTHFVDQPETATSEADHLITEVLRERGYPVDDFGTRADLVSVDHPDVVQKYRTAHDISVRNAHGDANTEDLRQAVVAYRSLFEAVLDDVNA